MKTLEFLRQLLGLPGNTSKEDGEAYGERKKQTVEREDSIESLQSARKYEKSVESDNHTSLKEVSSKSNLGVKASGNTNPRARGKKNSRSLDVKVGEFVHEERNSLKHDAGILRNTFIHLKGIGQQKEADLWVSGILTHEDAMSSNKLSARRNCLKTSKQNLEEKNWLAFYEGMNPKDHWRLFGDLINETAYVDIETTGLGSTTDIITTAVVHSLRRTYVFANGINLGELVDCINQFDLVVTYNGKTFDIPFIERFFKTKIKTPHIDLRYVLAGMGYKGGLKSCEKQLNLPNRSDMEDVDGFTAILLWNCYCRTKDPRSLETLLAYNYEDTVRLEWLMIEAYNHKASNLPFDTNLLEKPCLPANPYKSSPEILRRL